MSSNSSPLLHSAEFTKNRLLLAARSFVWLILLMMLIHLPARAQQEISIYDEISYPYLEKLIQTARENYPRTMAYNARIDAAEKNIKKTRLSYFDIFSFSYLLSPFNGVAAVNPNLLNGYQFGFFANIGSLIQKPAQIKQARDELDVIEHEKDVYLLSLEADVKRRYFEYVKAKAIYRVVSKSVLDSQALIDDMRYKFEKGEIAFENYNQALLDLANRQQTKINFAGDVLIAKSTLEELLGKKLEEIQ
jgi:outer membrane protein TolC